VGQFEMWRENKKPSDARLGFSSVDLRKYLCSLLILDRRMRLPIADKTGQAIRLRAKLFAGSEEGFIDCCF